MRSPFAFAFACACSCLLLACANNALPGGNADMVAPSDLTGTFPQPDLRGATCADIAQSVHAYLSAPTNLACKVDGDCASLTTACGLEGQCGFIANLKAPSSYLQMLVDDFTKQGCSIPCACPLFEPQPGCNNGVCGAKMFGSVGAACTSGPECLTRECASVGDGFPGGYCTITDCDLKDTMCPSDSECRNTDGMRSFCLKKCLGDDSCRPGYRCCSGPGPTTGAGWCAPETSFLCTAK
jgi:hypothetical protein